MCKEDKKQYLYFFMQLPQSMPFFQFYYSIKIELIYEIVRIHQLYYSKYFIIHFQRRQIEMSVLPYRNRTIW